MSASPEYVIVDGVAYPKAGTFAGSPRSEDFFGENLGQRFGEKVEQKFETGNFPEENPVRLLAADGASDDSPAVYDPHQVQREFPKRWQAYIRSNFRNIAHVQMVFPVSERTARGWWKGETGVNGSNVAIAVNEHPVAASRMLFAAE